MTPWVTLLAVIGGTDVLFAAISIPLINRRVPPNKLYGYRTRATLTNDAVWYDANAYFGRRLLAGSVISAIGALLLYIVRPPEQFLPLAVIALVMLPLIAAIATSRYIRRIHQGRP